MLRETPPSPFRVRQAGSAQTRPSGSNMRSPFPACRTLQSAHQRGKKMQVINGQCSLNFRRGSVHPKSPFRPAEQRTSRRGSPARLSEPEGRVPRRPPAGSSAGQSFAQRMTGVAGSPSLLTFLATQESQSAAGPRPGQRYAKHGKASPEGHERSEAQYPPPGPAYGSPCLYDAANPEVAAASNRESTPTAMKRAPALR